LPPGSVTPALSNIPHSSDTGKCYGCTKYLDVTFDARSKVPRDSKEFKEIFKDRQIIESAKEVVADYNPQAAGENPLLSNICPSA
jgi:hypothetical protein